MEYDEAHARVIPTLQTMTLPQLPQELVAHHGAVIKTLKARLKKMEAVWKLHQNGMTPVEICRRRKITRAELKNLMRDHHLYSMHAFIAEQIYHPRIVPVLKGGRTKMRTLELQAKKQIKYQLSPAGLKRTLAKDPREATFAQPENLHWAVVSYVNGTLFPAAKK